MKKETKERIDAMAAELRASCESNIVENAKDLAREDRDAEMSEFIQEIRLMYDKLCEFCFTESQAWELTKIYFASTVKGGK